MQRSAQNAPSQIQAQNSNVQKIFGVKKDDEPFASQNVSIALNVDYSGGKLGFRDFPRRDWLNILEIRSVELNKGFTSELRKVSRVYIANARDNDYTEPGSAD